MSPDSGHASVPRGAAAVCSPISGSEDEACGPETGEGTPPLARSSGPVDWLTRATMLVDEIIDHDDENGALANSDGDILRDALRVAAERLRVHDGKPPRSAWLIGSRRLVAEVWDLVNRRKIDVRSPAADAALDLRDVIDTRWFPDVMEERRR